MADIIAQVQEVLGPSLLSVSRPSENRAFLELDGKDVVPPAIEWLTNAQARLITITCVDLPAYHELLYHLDMSGIVVTLRARLWRPDVQMPSIAPINPAAELIEHEISELFGIVFAGNPRSANMILADGRAMKAPLEKKPGQLDARIDGNMSSIVEFSSTTAPSKRVMKARSQMGMSENPPLCSVTCPAKHVIYEIAHETGAVSRHPGLKKEAGK